MTPHFSRPGLSLAARRSPRWPWIVVACLAVGALAAVYLGMRTSSGRVRGAPAGPAEVLLLHEFLFDDLASLQAAMTSAEGQAAGLALMRFAGERAELFFAEHFEMGLEPPPGQMGTAEPSG